MISPWTHATEDAMAATGSGSGGADRYRVRVLREAESDPAWREFFHVPGDAREMQFKLALLESCGSIPPLSQRDSKVANYLDMDHEEVGGQRMYALEYSGTRGEREPWIVAIFYINEKMRTAYVAHVV